MADFLLHLESARAYGLVTGGPAVDVARCEEIVARGRKQGILPTPGNVERLTAVLC